MDRFPAEDFIGGAAYNGSGRDATFNKVTEMAMNHLSQEDENGEESRRHQDDFDRAWEHYYLGLDHLTKCELNMAITHFSQALELDPTFAECHRALAIAYARIGNEQSAMVEFNRAVDFDPQSSDNFLARGLARWRAGNMRGAYRDVERAIKLAPDSWMAFWNRGRLLLTMHGDEMLEPAHVDFENAIKLNGDAPEPFYYCGLIDFCLQNFKRAETRLGSAISMQLHSSDVDYAALWLYLAQCFQGRRAEADTKLAAFLSAKTANSYWPVPVIRYYMSMLDEKELLSDNSLNQRLSAKSFVRESEHEAEIAAAVAFHEFSQQERMLQAHFYVGQRYLTLGSTNNADKHFEIASQLSVGFPERWAIGRRVKDRSISSRQ